MKAKERTIFLSFKTVVVVFLVAIGILTVSPFTPDSTADSYYLYVKLTPVKCWDTSTSIKTLCYKTTEVDWWTNPSYHSYDHPASGYYTLAGSLKNYYTDSCYTGCNDS